LTISAVAGVETCTTRSAMRAYNVMASSAQALVRPPTTFGIVRSV
jgi:uncharacterized protein